MTRRATDTLREGTASLHQAAETSGFSMRLLRGEALRCEYVTFLRCLAVLHGVLETLASRSDADCVRDVWRDDMRKLPLLQADLRHLAPDDAKDAAGAMKEALRFVADLRSASLGAPERLVGCLYVLEGATNGGILLSDRVESAFGLDGDGVRYLRNYESRQPEAWSAFKARVDAAIPVDGPEIEHALEGATALFTSLGEILAAIGRAEDDRRVHATAFNPEAGDHRVPQEAREIAAVRVAAAECLAELPYVTERYGERGERYTASDGAWLATLVDLPDQVAARQVDWLARLLSGLGMPRYTLERHLALTEQRLAIESPEYASRYRVLGAIAERLASLRDEELGSAAQTAAIERFDAELGETHRSYAYVGELLASAVADGRLDGHDALEETLAWIRDLSGWPSAVVAASERLVAELEETAER